jgi:DNA-binding transcriptional regulator GbsR (MarR family)
MNRKNYLQSKILYALSKIDYASSQLNKQKNPHNLSKIYQVLMMYEKNVTLELLIKLTGLSRDEIVPKLKELKDYGVIDWDGAYFTHNTEIKNKVDVKEWYCNLMAKLKESGTKLNDDDEKFLKENRHLYHRENTTESISEKVSAPIIEAKRNTGDWVEIQLEDDLVVRTTKARLKKVLLG